MDEIGRLQYLVAYNRREQSAYKTRIRQDQAYLRNLKRTERGLLDGIAARQYAKSTKIG